MVHALTPTGVLGRAAARDRVEHAVHERGRAIPAEVVRELDRLVDHHLGRRVAVQELVHREPQQVAVDGGHPLDPPVARVLGTLGGLALLQATAGAFERAGIAVSTRPDPFTTAVVSGALVAVAIVAGALPALRAARVPPAEALRAY